MFSVHGKLRNLRRHISIIELQRERSDECPQHLSCKRQHESAQEGPKKGMLIFLHSVWTFFSHTCWTTHGLYAVIAIALINILAIAPVRPAVITAYVKCIVRMQESWKDYNDLHFQRIYDIWYHSFRNFERIRAGYRTLKDTFPLRFLPWKHFECLSPKQNDRQRSVLSLYSIQF